MSAATLRTVIRHLQRTLVSEGIAGVRDADLLGRFRATRDESAFETLLWRHGPMVLNVCRRVLRREADVEDAFQATFLALVRGVDSIRRSESVAAWLYRVSYRVAIKMETQRRRRDQIQANHLDQLTSPDSSEFSPDVRQLLDHEIHRLPSKYQTPVVLCYLEGKTTSEAAELLGLPRGTVGTRLAWARERLRARLARRGVAPGALLGLGESVTRAGSSQFLKAALLQLTSAAPTNVPAIFSRATTLLAGAVLRDMFVAKLKTAFAIGVSLTVVFAGAGILVERSVAAKHANVEAAETSAHGTDPSPEYAPPGVPTQEKPDDEPPPRVSVRGVVVDSAGSALGGAKVRLQEAAVARRSRDWLPSEPQALGETTADAQGRFSFNHIEAPTRTAVRPGAYPLDVVASAKGHAIAWKHLVVSDERATRLDLSPAASIDGTLVYSDGKPASGVRVRVREVADPFNVMRPSYDNPGYLDLTWAPDLLSAVTDERGKFAIEGLPKNVRVIVTVDDPRFARHDFYVTNGPNRVPPIKHNDPFQPGDPVAHVVHLNGFTATVQPSAKVVGRVVFDDTSQPAVGTKWAEPPLSGPPNRIIDKDGRFTVERLKLGKHRIYFYPPPGSEYLRTVAHIEVPSTDSTIEPVVRLRRGETVSGRVVDATTGNGVEGVEVENIQHRESASSEVYAKAITEKDGRFRLAVSIGTSQIVLTRVPPPYVGHAVRTGASLNDAGPEFLQTVNVAKGQPVAPIRFELKQSAVTSIRVQDPDGRPVPGALVRAVRVVEGGVGYATLPTARTSATGDFKLTGIRPDESAAIRVMHAERGLGGYFVYYPPANPQKNGPVEFVLQPLARATGRVLDAKGEPLPSVIVWVHTFDNGPQRGGDVRAVSTNADGQFTADLVAGVESGFVFMGEAHAPAGLARFFPVAGKTHEMGDTKLVKADQSVAGRIVDRDGNPVAGVTVFGAYNSPSGNAGRGSAGARLTDDQGRFHLRGIPHGVVDIYVDVAGVNREQRFPDIKVGNGDRDLEIVVDTKPQRGTPAAAALCQDQVAKLAQRPSTISTPAGRGDTGTSSNVFQTTRALSATSCCSRRGGRPGVRSVKVRPKASAVALGQESPPHGDPRLTL